MRLPRRGISPKADARGSRQLPWSRVIFEDWGAAARQSQTVGTSANPSTSRSGGSFLRPPRPSTVTGPGPSRTTSRERLGMQAPRSRPPDRCHSPSKRPHNRRAPRGAIDRNRSSDRRDRDPASPGVRDCCPSTDISNARPLPEPSPCEDPASGGSEEPRADGTTRPASRSDLVVSHHLAGFLRAKDRGLVASRYRSWGSPRFLQPAPTVPRPRHEGAIGCRG
jgi:hypothetical protein